MRLEADTANRTLVITDDHGGVTELPLYSKESFERLSDLWVTVGWNEKYPYTFSWLGRPVIQLPEDMIRLQEVVHTLQPDVIVETGVAHGGSLVFSASLCKAMDHGRVVGIDVEIRPHNRTAIEEHELSGLITLIEGDSVDPVTLERVRANIGSVERVLVLLDSGHARDHVLAELRAYGPLVSEGSYIVAMDGIMEQLEGAPRTEPDWVRDNPRQAVRDFLEEDGRFRLEEPSFAFNEGVVNERVTYWPGGFLLRGRS
jgi:cephalosporin hydroxylase